MSAIQRIFVSAIIKILRPLVRMALRQGMSYGTFADLSKWVFVDVASKEFGLPGKKVTHSRVSVISGLTRHDVKRVAEMPCPEETATVDQYNRSVSILAGWVKDPGYLDEEGQPVDLPFSGKDVSFESLVSRYGGDVTVRSIFDELLRSDSIEQLPKDLVRLKKNIFIPTNNEDQKYSILGSDVSNLLLTIDHNLHNVGSKDLLQLKSSSNFIPIKNLRFIRNEVKKKGLGFLQEFDQWLLSQEVDANSEEDVCTGGLGIYYFEDRSEKDKS